MRKRVGLILLLSVMTMALLPALAFAQTEDNSQIADAAKTDIAAQSQDPSNDPFDYASEADKKKALKAAENSFPDKYDLRDVEGKSYVTPVKFQNPFGTCWGFAAIAAAESSILGSGIAADDGYDESNLDLSEKHLVYFVSQAINDQANPQYGEGTHAEENTTLVDLLNGGGVPYMASSLFASGMGPNLESRDPILEYRGKNGWIQKRTAGSKVINYCYDDEDDWSIPEEWRFKQSYVLKESYSLPSPAKVDEETKAYEYNEAGTNAIKEMLMEKRAVQIGFCADTSSPSQERGDGVYISKNWAHYTYDADREANHAVTIIGWDDNYDKSNFVEGHEPPENGAWLVKNSWGSGEREFPNKGAGWGIEKDGVHTGYFWLSYYDKTLSLPEALAFERSNVENTYYIDEHDFMPVNEMTAFTLPKEVRMANVFKAEECETLDKVSCETTYPGTRVVNEVYLLQAGFTDPTDGILVDKTEATFEYGGFHTMELKTPDIIQKGQSYAVVQTQTTPQGDYAFNAPLAYGKEMSKQMDMNVWTEGVINSRESYVYMDGKWNDYSEDKIKETIFSPTFVLFALDNFPIKGYCTPRDNLSLRVRGNTKMDVGKENIFSIYYTGSGETEFDAPAVKWELAGEGSDSFTITPDPEHSDRVTVSAGDYGSALLTVTAEGIGTTVVRLTTNKRQLGSISTEGAFVYSGKAIKPKPVVEDEQGEVVPADSYTISYRNNKKCGQAEVLVKCKADDPKYEGDISGSFVIQPQKAVIRTVTPGKKKLTVKIRNQKASGVSYYRVSYREKGKSGWQTKKFKASGSKLVLKKLKTGKRYQVKVTAFGKNGFGGDTSKVKTSRKVR